jgi:hypothetical protein
MFGKNPVRNRRFEKKDSKIFQQGAVMYNSVIDVLVELLSKLAVLEFKICKIVLTTR